MMEPINRHAKIYTPSGAFIHEDDAEPPRLSRHDILGLFCAMLLLAMFLVSLSWLIPDIAAGIEDSRKTHALYGEGY